MYIKIKIIKQSLLILACLFFAGFNYLNFVKADDTTIIDSDKDGLTDAEEQLYATNPNNADTDEDGYSDGVEIKSGYDPLKAGPEDKIATVPTSKDSRSSNGSLRTSDTSLTEEFLRDFSQYIESKKGQSVSAQDVQVFTDNALASIALETPGGPIPEIDSSKLNIQSQSYASISETKKKQLLQHDATKYLSQISYLLASNSPSKIETIGDLVDFQNDLTNRLADISLPENQDYFSDLGYRLELFSVQLNTLGVPETMVDLHIRFAEIINEILAIRNLPSYPSSNDPLGNMIILMRARDLSTILADFLSNDLTDYLQKIK